MKTQVAPYETSAKCLRIICTNGLTIRVTRYPVDLVMSNGQVYQTGSGYDFTGYQATTSLSASAIDMEGILGFAGVTRDAMQSGIFDGARCYLFACNFLNPVEDYEPIVCSVLGKATFNDNRYTVEEMALIDALNQSAGWMYTPGCQNVFGGQNYAGCKVALGPLTVTGALSSVTDSLVFRDSARTEVADWFGGGTIQFTSGLNAWLKPLEIKSYAADGTITLFEPLYYMPEIGDAYSLIPGCRKRLIDCRDKWGNVANMKAFPHMPTSSIYAQRGTN